MPVNYGVIGCGAIAQRRHLPEAADYRYSKVAAVADPNEARAREIAGQYGAEAYTDPKQMLKNADIDAAVICGPNALHAKQSIDALRAGKHVLCEKPMATTKADCRKMIREAKKAKKYLMIGQNQRLMPPHAKAKAILDSNTVGKPLAFRTTFKHPGPDGWSIDGAKSWFFDPEAAFMGATGDLGVHKADLMRWMLGEEFTEVGGLITTRDKKDSKGKLLGLDDNAYLTLQTKSGILGSLEVSWTNYGEEENHTIIYCSKGVIKMGFDPVFGVIVEYANGDYEQHKVGEMATNVKQVASGVIDSFTDAIRKNKAPEIDGEEGYKAVNVILTAMDAAKEGKMLKIQY